MNHRLSRGILPALVIFLSLPVQGANPRGTGWEAALEQTGLLEVVDGLEARLFASEPMVVNPTNMDIDARGRVWVTEGANYRLWKPWGKLREGGDRIVILEDTDLDGVADVQKVFYQGDDVNAALGICVLGNRVIVSCSPDVLLLTDTDGDDKADVKEVLFSGIGGVDHDHGVHAFVFGSDGRLYFNFGNNGKRILDGKGNPIRDPQGNPVEDKGNPYRQGMVFRCNPDLSGFEVLGHNFRNNYEVCVDSFGTLWQSDNDDDGNKGVRINYVMEYGNFGYQDERTGAGWRTERSGWEETVPERHWHLNDPGVVPNLLQTGAGSPTGILVYEGQLLPDPFRNQIIHCDAGPRVVRAYPVGPDGAGYRAQIVDIVTGEEDPWFRPADVCVAPDGALFIADWNDGGVGGHNMADRSLETLSGRILRVAPPGNIPRRVDLDISRVEHALRALNSPNLAYRYLGWKALEEMGNRAEYALRRAWESPWPRHRARALPLLARLPGRAELYIGQGIGDAVADIRITTLRIARERGLSILPLVERLVDDPHPAVRRECAIALRHDGSEKAAELWARLARQHDGRDRWYLEALGIGAQGQEDRFFAAWLEQVDNKWNTPGGRDIVWRSRARQSAPLLVEILKTTAEAERPRYFRALDFIDGPEKDAALLELLSVE